MDVLLFLLTILVMTAFFALGGYVQRKCRFVWPHDIVTIMMIIFIIVDTFMPLTSLFLEWVGVIASPLSRMPYSPIWYLAALIGYFAGYIVSARRIYTMLMPISFAMCLIGARYVVPYKHSNKWFFQDQKNRELLKRWIFGIEHEVETNCNFDEAWELTVKSPLLPTFKWKVIPIEKVYDDNPPKIVRKDKLIKCRQYRTHVLVAPSTMASKLDMIYKEGAHEHDIYENNRLRNALMKEQQITQRTAVTVASDALTHATVDSTPGAQLVRIQEEYDKAERRTKEKKKKDGDDDGTKE